MPGPPPPPPAAPPPPMFGSPSAFNTSKGPDDRSALLKSIQKGTKLKKTVTNDKSAPLIGKVTNNNSSSSVNNGGSNFSSSPAANGMGLGGLFAGGMPKLKPTKNRLGNNLSDTSTSNGTEKQQNGYVRSPRERSPAQPPSPFNFSSIQNEVKKKLANDNKDRGPPPPTPTTESVTAEFNNISIQQSSSSSYLHPSAPANSSSLHRKTQSNVNLSSVESSLSNLSPVSTLSVSSKSINHGKPNLAPKPPILNGKPRTPPKKLVTNGKVVSRAHSLKSPRSPTTQGLDSPIDAAIKYGTVRNMSSVLSHSIGNNLNTRSKMTLNGRPSAPPPSVPETPPSHQSHQQSAQAPAPPSKTAFMKPPNHAPPPPPGGALPQAPNHAPPPPPPHKTLSVKSSGMSFSTSQTPPPPPPPRNSSMRDQNNVHRKPSMADFDERFKDMFKSPSSFPRPPPFRNVLKIYSNRQVVNKQQAPPPPSPLLPNNRLWDVSSSC